jgi:hypothetical protein
MHTTDGKDALRLSECGVRLDNDYGNSDKKRSVSQKIAIIGV